MSKFWTILPYLIKEMLLLLVSQQKQYSFEVKDKNP